jgi:7-cyano-7-deazaguanine synthase
MKKYKAVVVHSGGMDSSICLLLAIKTHGRENVLSLGFTYGQRHSVELVKANEICKNYEIDRTVIDINCLSEITDNALINNVIPIGQNKDKTPNTLVVGRNGLMTRLAAIHAQNLGASEIYLGVIEVEEANSGYRDCSRNYMDKMQEILQIDLDDNKFYIQTPIVKMNKLETMVLADDEGELKYLLENTISCYEGFGGIGCEKCPACLLRNEGIREFIKLKPEFEFSYKSEII